MPSKLDDPAWRQERARKAGKANRSTDTLVKTLVRRESELSDDHRAALHALALAQTDPQIRQAIEDAPPLSAEQISRLRELLPAADTNGGRS